MDLQDQVDDLNFRIDQKETALRGQFSRLENTMARLQSQGNFITQQVANMGNVFGS